MNTSVFAPADLRDQRWLDEQVADLGRGIEAARSIWSNWFDGRQVGRLHPGMTPGEYIASLGMRLTLPEALAAMPDASTRQVAAVAGVGTMTVSRARAGVPSGTPEPIRGADGKSYPRVVREVPKWNPGAIMSSDSVEWYTPRHILDAVAAAMGGIDLDPCADPGRAVPADVHYTIEDDGLSRGWRGRVYMNPPYGREIGDWIEKLAIEYEAGNISEAIALVPARTDTAWWVRLDTLATAICLVTGRLSFSGADPAPFPSAVVYLGPSLDDFERAFRSVGLVHPGPVRKLAAVAAA